MCDCVKMFMMRYQPFTNLLSTLIEPSLARFHGDAVCTAWRGRGCVCRCVCTRVHVREMEGERYREMKCS